MLVYISDYYYTYSNIYIYICNAKKESKNIRKKKEKKLKYFRDFLSYGVYALTISNRERERIRKKIYVNEERRERSISENPPPYTNLHTNLSLICY
jgi:hypothetical protein